MTPIITAFKNSPDRGRGLARDMRVRWALEEVGQPYDVELLSFERLKGDEYLKLHPFGQIPTYREGDFELFESGAILLYLAEKHGQLLPKEQKARAHAIMWAFAAVNSVEPPIAEYGLAFVLERDKEWYEARKPMLEERVHNRLKGLAAYLGEQQWLDGEFSIGDILMVTVLRRLLGKGVIEHYAGLMAYIARGEARPAYQRAFAAQLAVYNDSLKA